MAYNKNNNERSNEPIEFEIVDHIETLSESQGGWTKEVNIVSWNKGTPKYDLREWSPDHERMTKGLTLFEEEAKRLASGLSNHFAERQTTSKAKSNEPADNPSDVADENDANSTQADSNEAA